MKQKWKTNVVEILDFLSNISSLKDNANTPGTLYGRAVNVNLENFKLVL